MTMPRIGFCCKWIDRPDQVNGLRPSDSARLLTTGTTTLSWLARQTQGDAEQRLSQLAEQNMAASLRLVERVGALAPCQRMVRLSSDIIPAATAPDWAEFWRQPAQQSCLLQGLGQIGSRARELGVRLSFHPGQFCVLASENDNIVERSIEEFEYHADMARMMGYGAGWHDHGFKINVHMSGRGGVRKFLNTLDRLSPTAQNLISIENDEMSAGLDTVLELSSRVAIVLDVHHHWIHSRGEYISPRDPRVSRVIESWRGVRPVLHYSVSREDVLVEHAEDTAPCLVALLDKGFNRQQLRAHSDFYWNQAATDWVLGLLDNFDICCEAKGKNLASSQVVRRARELALIGD